VNNEWVEAVSKIQYKDWRFGIGNIDSVFYLQIWFDDLYTGEKQYCRKWMLYPTMNVSEVVRTAWMAVLAAEEHEARELFRYRGRRIFGPHFDVDAMAEFAKSKENIALTADPV
jgi:hypothetical protein